MSYCPKLSGEEDLSRYLGSESVGLRKLW